MRARPLVADAERGMPRGSAPAVMVSPQFAGGVCGPLGGAGPPALRRGAGSGQGACHSGVLCAGGADDAAGCSGYLRALGLAWGGFWVFVRLGSGVVLPAVVIRCDYPLQLSAGPVLLFL